MCSCVCLCFGCHRCHIFTLYLTLNVYFHSISFSSLSFFHLFFDSSFFLLYLPLFSSLFYFVLRCLRISKFLFPSFSLFALLSHRPLCIITWLCFADVLFSHSRSLPSIHSCCILLLTVNRTLNLQGWDIIVRFEAHDNMSVDSFVSAFFFCTVVFNNEHALEQQRKIFARDIVIFSKTNGQQMRKNNWKLDTHTNKCVIRVQM